MRGFPAAERGCGCCCCFGTQFFSSYPRNITSKCTFREIHSIEKNRRTRMEEKKCFITPAYGFFAPKNFRSNMHHYMHAPNKHALVSKNALFCVTIHLDLPVIPRNFSGQVTQTQMLPTSIGDRPSPGYRKWSSKRCTKYNAHHFHNHPPLHNKNQPTPSHVGNTAMDQDSDNNQVNIEHEKHQKELE